MLFISWPNCRRLLQFRLVAHSRKAIPKILGRTFGDCQREFFSTVRMPFQPTVSEARLSVTRVCYCLLFVTALADISDTIRAV